MNKPFSKRFVIQIAVVLALVCAITAYFLLNKEDEPAQSDPPSDGVYLPSQPVVSSDAEIEKPKPVEIAEVSSSESFNSDSGKLIFRYTLSLPEISGGGPGVADTINAYYEGLREGVKTGDIERIISLAEFDSSAPNFVSAYSYRQDYEIVLNDQKTLSIRRIIDIFEGGVQSQSFFSFDVFSLETGKKLALSSLFNCGPEIYMPKIMGIVSEMIAADPAMGDAYYAITPEELSEVFNQENFCLKSDSLVILFQSYDIAPHSSGIPEFEISLSALSDILAER